MKTAEILLIEDNRGDVVLLTEAFKQTGWDHRLHVVRDGIEAIEFLRHQGRHPNAAQPDLILLDLNLPSMGGRAILANIRPDPALGRIPVVILTSSSFEDDVLAAFDLPRNAYMVKPSSFDGFVEMAGQLEAFWRQAAECA